MIDRSISDWQKEVLKSEQYAFVGAQSYKVMQKTHRRSMSTGEICQKLQRLPNVKRYFKILDGKLELDIIDNGLEQFGLGSKLRKSHEDEWVFEPVPELDFEGRMKRLIGEVLRVE